MSYNGFYVRKKLSFFVVTDDCLYSSKLAFTYTAFLSVYVLLKAHINVIFLNLLTLLFKCLILLF